MERVSPRLPLPAFAPLCEPMVFQLLYHHVGTRSAWEAITRYSLAQEQLLEDVAQHRSEVYADIAPLVDAERLTTQAFVDLLRAASPAKSKPTEQLASFWRSRGILRMQRRGYPDPQSAAAVLLARRVATAAQRGWLPAEILPAEPIWWCWRQDHPRAPVQHCPMPLPSDLPTSALIWTAWPGAIWLPGWIGVEGGAVYVPALAETALIEEVLTTWQQTVSDDVRITLRVLASSEARHRFARELLTEVYRPLASVRIQLQLF